MSFLWRSRASLCFRDLCRHGLYPCKVKQLELFAWKKNNQLKLRNKILMYGFKEKLKFSEWAKYTPEAVASLYNSSVALLHVFVFRWMYNNQTVAGRCFPKAVSDAVNLYDSLNNTIVQSELEQGVQLVKTIDCLA